ncbi:MAG: ECF-type sigma factor [Gemmataceae bacterium]
MPDESVTHWLGSFKAGDPAGRWTALGSLLRLSSWRRAGPTAFRRAADEEDVVLAAFDSFCRDAAAGRLPRLDDRDDLRVLLLITGQKAIDLVRRETATKRGGKPEPRVVDLEDIVGREPSPEFAALVAEEFRRLLGKLPDADLQALAVWKMEGHTNEEIAARRGCVLRTVERRLRVIRSLWAAELAP